MSRCVDTLELVAKPNQHPDTAEISLAAGCQSSRSSHSHFPAVRRATCYRTEDILIGDSGLDRLDRPEQSAICDEGT